MRPYGAHCAGNMDAEHKRWKALRRHTMLAGSNLSYRKARFIPCSLRAENERGAQALESFFSFFVLFAYRTNESRKTKKNTLRENVNMQIVLLIYYYNLLYLQHYLLPSMIPLFHASTISIGMEKEDECTFGCCEENQQLTTSDSAENHALQNLCTFQIALVSARKA